MNKFVIPQQKWWEDMLKEDWKVSWDKRKKSRETSLWNKLKKKLTIIWYASGIV